MAEHNYISGGVKAFYNVKGQYMTCHSKDEEARAKAQGYTSANYIRSPWPKTAYSKKTGESKLIGKIENSDEDNAKAVATVTGDWTFDYIPIPEVQKPKAAEPMDVGVLAQILSEMADQRKQIIELQEALLASRPPEPPPMIDEAPAPIRPRKTA